MRRQYNAENNTLQYNATQYNTKIYNLNYLVSTVSSENKQAFCDFFGNGGNWMVPTPCKTVLFKCMVRGNNAPRCSQHSTIRT